MRSWTLIACMAATVLVAACGKKTDVPVASFVAPAPISPAPLVPVPPVAPIPDVGKLEEVTVTSRGSGPTAGMAVEEAMKLAILEVNGAAIDSSSIALKFGLDVAADMTEASLRGAAFAEAITQHSRGAVTHFKLVSMTEPADKGGPYKVTIEAAIARFAALADAKRIKIVVAPLRVSAASFVFGSQTVPAATVAADIRQQLIDALTATGRFSVLDRDFGAEVEQELDLIASGQTPNPEMAKLSQVLSADIVWVGTINQIAYRRNARKLVSSDRKLVSYSGGWSVSQRILNVATRQILMSSTLQARSPDTEPTTLDLVIDGAQIARSMESAIATDTMVAILGRTFPVTIIAKDGLSVVLSQGGQSVRESARYAVVSMGQEMTDPQTQQSLGRIESPCCEVVIDKVGPTMAYGHLENAKLALDAATPANLQVRGEIQPTKVATANKPRLDDPKAKQAPTSSGSSSADVAPAAPVDDKKW
jgi:curli biogenesis system outer membrane secretion channel CsgG